MTRDEIIVRVADVVCDRHHRSDEQMLAEVQSSFIGEDMQTATVMLMCLIFVKEEFGTAAVRDVQHKHRQVVNTF